MQINIPFPLFSDKASPKYADIYNKKKVSALLKCTFGEGINAASQIQNSFKVYPVQMVARTAKLKRENGNPRHNQPEHSALLSFGGALRQAAEKNCPEEVCLVTYSADRQLQTHYYRPSREYTF